MANRLRFKGWEWDAVTGLYAMRARWYDLATGWFLSDDPLGLAGGANEYAVAGNDPVNRRDPSDTKCELMATVQDTYVNGRFAGRDVLDWFVAGRKEWWRRGQRAATAKPLATCAASVFECDYPQSNPDTVVLFNRSPFDFETASRQSVAFGYTILTPAREPAAWAAYLPPERGRAAA